MTLDKNKIIYTTESKDNLVEHACSDPKHEKDDYGCVSCFSNKTIEETYK